ncbi:MAG: MFS transporter [Patescibacteria group bacterium]|jgi:predicted MFS family arabinose efflux permease|nr:MFS transporter [Patescibacteria group bacterium]
MPKKTEKKESTIKNKDKKFNLNKSLVILYILCFFIALASALPTYINSNFLSSFVSLQTISIFFVIANLFSFFLILTFPKIIKTVKDSTVFKALLVVYILSLFFFSTATSAWQSLLGLIFFVVFSSLLFIKLDLYLEKFTDNFSTGRVRTIYFTFYNLGLFLAPSISGLLVDNYNYSFVYWVAGLIVIPALIFFSINENFIEKKIEYKKEGVIKEFKKMIKNKDLRGVFVIAFILQLFYSTVVVYIPVYLHQYLGFGWEALGPIFSLMLLPFILIEIPAGNLADKYFGEKEMLIIGLVIMSISLFLFYYVSVSILWIWAIILFLSRIGAALIEAMRESYFFKLVDAEDIDMINIFRVTRPLAFILGPAAGILILAFLPLPYLFLFMAAIVLLSLTFVLPMKDTK